MEPPRIDLSRLPRVNPIGILESPAEFAASPRGFSRPLRLFAGLLLALFLAATVVFECGQPGKLLPDHGRGGRPGPAPALTPILRTASSRLSRLIGLVRWASKPASRLWRTSSSMP